jgi:hypothetical protein
MIDYALLRERLPAIIEETGFRPFDMDVKRVVDLAEVNAEGAVFPLAPTFVRAQVAKEVLVVPRSGPQELGEYPHPDLWARWTVRVSVTLTEKGATIEISKAKGSTAQMKAQVKALAEAVAFAEALEQLL